MKKYRWIGLMSGTSLDGLDLADVTFTVKDDHQQVTFRLNNTAYFDYSAEMRSALEAAVHKTGEELSLLSVKLCQFYARSVVNYLGQSQLSPDDFDGLASHGQTIFHQPDQRLTLQIGNLPHLAVDTGIPTVTDFRSRDVALGGNGAPLVPVADRDLFSEVADSCLNLGGFSNLSFAEGEVMKSYDVCPVNIVINHLVMRQCGLSFDENGNKGREGAVDSALLDELNQLDYYAIDGPKSLGWEWVEKNILPRLKGERALTTYYHHCAQQIAISLHQHALGSVYVTGGGAHNAYLMDLIEQKFEGQVIRPAEEIIDYKEAIAFAYLGLLRVRDKTNVLSSVTGARADSSSGIIDRP
ncbi:MAG: anhydro-N-acetylmuramic acid kinase [Bacteroidota bacterium]